MCGDVHLEWLRKNKAILVAGGYSSLCQINRIINEVEIKIEAKNLRKAILEHAGLKRIFLIIKLYSSGGYTHFSGWKSAVKDLFFN
jgi:hypothetical protein